MSADTMAAHDDGLEEARVIVRREMEKHFASECDCEQCVEWKRAQRRILTALRRAKDQP